VSTEEKLSDDAENNTTAASTDSDNSNRVNMNEVMLKTGDKNKAYKLVTVFKKTLAT